MAYRKNEDGLTDQQRMFVQEYIVDLNSKQAAIRSGYSPRSAEQQGSRLLSNAKVQIAIRKAQAGLQRRTQVTQEWVVNGIVENITRCMQAEPILDRDGNPTGVYKWEPNAANKGYELLGKHLGMFTDKIDMRVTSVEQLLAEMEEE